MKDRRRCAGLEPLLTGTRELERLVLHIVVVQVSQRSQVESSPLESESC
jgi:hypothetical protein